MGDAIKPEKGIPVPPPRGRRARYPWRELEVGDSFYVPGKAASQMAAMKARYKPAVFTCRTVDGGVRVWRVA